MVTVMLISNKRADMTKFKIDIKLNKEQYRKKYRFHTNEKNKKNNIILRRNSHSPKI